MAIKIYHEAPLDIFDWVQECTDGDYFLVHLFEKNNQYFETAVRASQEGRETILDNSVFELGEAFNSLDYISWIERMKPDWYIIPDVLGNAEATMDNVDEWYIDGYIQRILRNTDGKSYPIAVAQGQSIDDIVKCYDGCAGMVGMMSIPFALPFFANEDGFNIHDKRMRGRQRLVYELFHNRGIQKQTHLLGCALPQEGLFYKNLYPRIVSVDTSNPILHGLEGYEYDIAGLSDKLPGLMADRVDEKISLLLYEGIGHNMTYFRSYWS